ncbi:hypothetical protein HYZ99_03955 [Candidatus Peregrinibacteria bacterium]|nr:hypothetical protein [Candidatus Peregrinibacteria bacterium]
MLAACGGSGGEQAQTVTTGNANKAVQSIMKLFVRTAENSRPSPMLGLFVSLYLERGTVFAESSALRGLGATVQLEAGDRMSLDDTFALLQELGTALQVDVPELLNRSQNRAETLNQYLSQLHSVARRSFTRNQQLEGELEALSERQREERAAVTAIQRVINKALREKDYGTAGAEQKSLVTAQTKLDMTEGELERMRDIQRAFRDLLEIAEERVTAIEQNREILIAGLSVVELPGIEDLGIIMDSEGEGRRRGESIFGPIQ